VAALGYFVDIYDLILFSIVRVKSLTSLGLNEIGVRDQGIFIINMQMGGMLLGGILWGMLGDKKGRLSVLFGSIFLYSAANIANGFATSVDAYAWLRFIAGVGLAGELGAGITLVSEIMHKEKRGYGTMIVASVGILGAVVASLVGAEDWRTAYFVGGGMGLLLLALRIGVYESGMFTQLRESAVRRGSFLSLFTSRERFVKYLGCILIGLPLWFLVGILVTFSKELGTALGVVPAPSPGAAIMYCYIGLAAGDLASGALSQWLRSRKKVALGFIIFCAVMVTVYCLAHGVSLTTFYVICVFIGLSGGYWAIFVTIASEQFGTNIRATVTTTVPNFVRGAVVPMTLLFKAGIGELGIIQSAALIGGSTIIIALIALANLEETYGKDLDYIEA
jgi:MFS family permease